MRKRSAAIPSCCLLALLSGCLREVPVAEAAAMEPERPTMVLEDARYVYAANLPRPIAMQAETMEIDEVRRRAELYGVVFSQDDEEGVQGSAKKATIDLDTRNVLLEGDVTVSQPSSGFSLSAGQVSWDNDAMVLESGDDGDVTVSFDGDSRIEGTGFRGDLQLAVYEFRTVKEGVFGR